MDYSGSTQRGSARRALAPLLITLALALSLTATGGAQQGSVSLGAIIGYSRAALIGSDAQGLSGRGATLAGAFVRIPATPWFAVEPELLFARKGGSSGVLPGQAGRLDFEFVYLEAPVLARFRGPRIGKIIRPIVFAGPSTAFLISCDVQIIGGGPSQRAPCDKSTINSVDVSAVLGGGIELGGLGNSLLGIEVRYVRGLRRATTQNLDVRNSLWGILAEVPF